MPARDWARLSSREPSTPTTGCWTAPPARGSRLDWATSGSSFSRLEGGGTEHVALEDGSSTSCLTDEQLRELAALGRRVQAQFGAPQDIEFAFDEAGRCFLVQARPITTLYPLPPGAPAPNDGLAVYFSVNVAQGVFRPITPMGIQIMRMLAGSLATAFGAPPSDPYAGPATVVEAGNRVFLNVTPVMRHPLGQRIFIGATRFMEALDAEPGPRTGP